MCPRLFTTVFAALIWTPVAVAQVGDVTRVHDPSIARCGDAFYLFSTGHDGFVHTSPDLFTWHAAAAALPALPVWTQAYDPPGNAPWAPDVTLFNGRWYMYYAVSNFGRRRSAIGLATNATLDPSRPDYRWDDRGRVVGTVDGDTWNAIDPAAATDADGHRWLVLGSCWSGIKLLRLDDATGLLAPPDQRPIALAAHPPDNIIEEGYVRRHGDAYYLWVSAGHCCRGVGSDYRILVGRSPRIGGPYLDRDGRPMLGGGGTVVLASDGRVRGPGSCAIAERAGHDYLIHHYYDADHRGRPTLGVRPLVWDADGWPLAGEPLARSPGAATRPASPVGDWTVALNFDQGHRITLDADGTVRPAGHWAATGTALTLRGPGIPADVRCTLADDGTWFVGRDPSGRQVRGVRPRP